MGAAPAGSRRTATRGSAGGQARGQRRRRAVAAQVVDAIRERIQAQHHDLLSLQPCGSGFSLVVCKNVLLHFQPDQRCDVIRMFHGAMEPGAIFVTEHTQKMPDEVSHLFEQLVSDSQVFRKREVPA